MAEYRIDVEFPDYPVASLPGDIPEWLECVPWHNEACPIWYEREYDDPEATRAAALKAFCALIEKHDAEAT